MANNLISIFNKMITPNNVQQPTVTRQIQSVDTTNPFNPNPFVNTKIDMSTYAKNRPVQGGYFAGYYNGRPNIVGKRLFVEV